MNESYVLIWERESDRVWSSQTVDHELWDTKGRKVGGYARIVRYDETEDDPEFYELEIQGTRDGARFGPRRPWTRFNSLPAAKAVAGRKLAEQRKRYEKVHKQGGIR